MLAVAGGASREHRLSMLGVGSRSAAYGKRKKDQRLHRQDCTLHQPLYTRHACTSGPGLRRYCVVIACADQYASAPTVPVGL